MANEETKIEDAWQKQLLLYAGNDPTIASSLCDAFLEEVPLLLQKITTRLQSQNTNGLHHAIHTLKSCLNYVAPDEEVQLASELETQAKKDDFVIGDKTRSDFAQLKLASTNWVARVREFRDELKS